MSTGNFTCRWALLGLSNIAETFVTDILLPRPDPAPITHKVVAISTTGSKERATTWLTNAKVPHVNQVQIFQSFEEMLATADFDVVYISTPHSVHFLHVQTALHHKRHVLVEKPATMNRSQYAVLAELAKRQGAVLMEAMWTRYLPASVYVCETLVPKLGQVKRVFADFSFACISPEMATSTRQLDRMAGAGAILDMGIYSLTWVDMALGGSPRTQVVYAETIPYHTGADEIDDITTVVLRRPSTSSSSAATAIATTSLSLPGSSKIPIKERLQSSKLAPAVRIEGTEGAIAVDFPTPRPCRIRVQWYGKAHLDEGGHEREEVIDRPVERGWGLWYPADVIAKEVESRRSRGIDDGEGFVIGEEETVRVMGWLDAARKKAGIQFDSKLEAV